MILASASPRRRELLERAGFGLRVMPANIEESSLVNERPEQLVERLATGKALACLEQVSPLEAGETILGADTIVWADGDVLGKPVDDSDAVRMLRMLSGKTHHVTTGVCLIANVSGKQEIRSFVDTSDVVFRALTDKEIIEYVRTGEPLDKAGAYGIQGGAASFVESLEGDYSNVVGLPVVRVLAELKSMGAPVPRETAAPASINNIAGIIAAHCTNEEGGTGCTVIVCPKGATGAVDVRGGAPATRETDLLKPEETVQQIHAVVLSGGSAFGLAASCGVANELERAEIGLDVGVTHVPIVSGACLFDLSVADPYARPTVADGAQATCKALLQQNVPAALREPLAQGNVGAGTGCSVGKFAGTGRCMKSGLGECVCVSGELVCGAVAAVNACGDVVEPKSGKPIAGTLSADGTHIISSAHLLGQNAADKPLERTNTTISCVVTNARLTKAEATKVAQMAADAYAHALRPAHTTNDGDTIFVMATNEVASSVDAVGVLACDALQQAIANGAKCSCSAYGLKSATELADAAK